MRVVVVDDEPPARRKLHRLLASHPNVEVVGEAGSGEEAVKVLDELRPDIVFLDIQLPDMDGFEVLRRVRAPAPFRPVFITAFDAFAVKAFEVEAIDYLLKPVDPRRFDAMIERAKDAAASLASSAYPMRFLITDRDRAHYVQTASIEWIESDRNYVVLHEGGREHLVRATLESFVKSLDPAKFTRISRSHVVQTEAIAEMRPVPHGERLVVMKGGATFTWTRRYRA